MTDLNLRTVGMYAVGILVIAACFWLIATSGDASDKHVQEWATITGIIGYLIRDAGGAAGTRAAERITASNASAQPTTTVSSPPVTVTTTPSDDPAATAYAMPHPPAVRDETDWGDNPPQHPATGPIG